MHRVYRLFLVSSLLILVGLPMTADEPLVVATTPWSGAFAAAAGAEEVTILAPFDLQHPPEYELKPSDLKAVSNADVLVYAGYEVMMRKLKSTLGGDTGKLIQITTNYARHVIRESVLSIASVLGTTTQANENLKQIDQLYESWQIQLNDLGLLGTPVIVHFFHRPLVEELGFTIAGVFGPGPLEPQQISELAKTGAKLIIDNWHNAVAAPLGEVIDGSTTLEWINFPGKSNTRSLLDVLNYNRNQLAAEYR